MGEDRLREGDADAERVDIVNRVGREQVFMFCCGGNPLLDGDSRQMLCGSDKRQRAGMRRVIVTTGGEVTMFLLLLLLVVLAIHAWVGRQIGYSYRLTGYRPQKVLDITIRLFGC